MARVVEAPRQRSTRSGSLLTTGLQLDGARLLEGIAFRPEPCQAGGTIEFCEAGTKEIVAPSGDVCVNAVGMWTGDQCSAITGVSTIEETIRRVTARLDITTSHKLEEYFWTGAPFDLTAEGACTEATLASEAAEDITPGDGPLDIVPAVAALIEALDDGLQGARGIVHIPRWTLPYFTFYGVVERFNTVLQLTNTDHMVIAGAGYPGTDPDGLAPLAGETWVYATGAVEYALDDIFVPGADDPASLVDRSVNTVEVRAERAGAAWFDPCVHAALNVCLPNPGPGCETS